MNAGPFKTKDACWFNPGKGRMLVHPKQRMNAGPFQRMNSGRPQAL